MKKEKKASWTEIEVETKTAYIEGYCPLPCIRKGEQKITFPLLSETPASSAAAPTNPGPRIPKKNKTVATSEPYRGGFSAPAPCAESQ